MIRLKTFGAPALLSDQEEPIAGAAGRGRRLALLAILAAAGEDGVSRDRLVSLLWPDVGDDQARHTLAQVLYRIRRDFPGAEVVTGTAQLRVNPAVIETDVSQLEGALDRGDTERLLQIYGGPFLDGFSLSNAPEFDRWVDGERSRFALKARVAFERAGRDADERRDVHRAVEWWRRVVAADPHDARAAVALMAALAAVGDQSGAIQHAQVHETLVRDELDAPPDPAVAALAERMRATKARTRRRRSRVTHGLTAAAALLLSGALGARVMWGHHASTGQVFAIGMVRDYTSTDSSGAVHALPDMLATNLARVPSLSVVSNARIYELVGTGRSREGRDLAAQLSNAAKRAGATEIIDGTLYRYRPGVVRFDVRRIDLATGAIRKVYSVEGADPFELVDRATAQLTADVSAAPTEPLHVADVTTRSLVAYRFYEEGLRAYYQQNDMHVAHRLFLSAVAEDSTFAMAEFYTALTEIPLSIGSPYDRIAHAARLAERSPDRERLLIQGTAAQELDDPSVVAIAETLATHYPAEPDGHLLLGRALTWSGDFLGALPHLRRVVTMDSLSLRGGTARCAACDALETIATSYWLADSVPAAQRTAREWLRVQPSASGAWNLLVRSHVEREQFDSARASEREAARLSPALADPTLDVLIALRRGDFADADAALRRQLRDDPASLAGWLLTVSLRYQGRLREALDVARGLRTSSPGERSTPDVSEGIVLFDIGRRREAAAVFSEIGDTPKFGAQFRSRVARDRLWNLTHQATALAAGGDTSLVPRLADSIQHLGAQSAYGRDRRLYHYVRGLMLRARGQLPDAVDEFQRGLFSTTDGYTRNSYELARTLIALHRPKAAVAILQPAFRGSLQGSNSYVTLSELHEAIGDAFDAMGQADSAAVHYGYVVRAWAHADESFRARRAHARARIAAIKSSAP